MMQYQPFSPVDIRFGSMQTMEDLFSSLTDKRTLVVASEGALKRLKECVSIDRFISSNQNRLISDVNPNPSVDDVQRQINVLRSEDKYECILAIGGGSSIDLAKAISALHGIAETHDVSYEEIVEAISEKSFFKGDFLSDIIAVPTTAGTGSEVTRWATVWDFENKKKLSVEHPKCYPKHALIVPELTLSMPKRLTLATGLDALSHAMEGFWAKQRNPLSQALAKDSIERIKHALPAALGNLSDIEAREEMCLGSLLAGLSFSMTKTTACHSISYPLTMNHDVEHGFAAALTLSSMMRINQKVVPELSQITNIFGGINGFEKWLFDVSKDIQELRLSAFDIKEDDLESITNGAFTLGRMDNNPVMLEKSEVKKILINIL